MAQIEDNAHAVARTLAAQAHAGKERPQHLMPFERCLRVETGALGGGVVAEGGERVAAGLLGGKRVATGGE
jgi:hypothetical protein